MKKMLLCALLMASMQVAAEDRQIQLTPEQIDNLAIQVAPLSASGQHTPLFSAPATVVVPANHDVLISASQPGLLTQLSVNIGDAVAKGQVVAQVHSPELVTLQQQFLAAENELHLANLELQRDKKLLQEGVIAERRWQETQALQGSKSTLSSEARQLLAMAGMSAREIEGLRKTHTLTSVLNIRAPIDGVVLERAATLGARLDIQAPLYRVADLSQLWLEINVPQERLAQLKIGDRVQVDGANAQAVIRLLGQSVDPNNQTVMARAVIEGTAALRLGQHVNVQVLQQGAQPGFKVPNTAIALNEGHAYVFVRNANGFGVTEVTIMGKQGQETIVTGPLNPQQTIAVQGSVALKANWLGLGGDD